MLNVVREKELNLEGTISRKKNAKILLYGKSHEKAGLSKRIGYEYDIMKLVGYGESTRSLADKVLLWKSYNEHGTEEIRQLRGRVSILSKISSSLNLMFSIYCYTNYYCL